MTRQKRHGAPVVGTRGWRPERRPWQHSLSMPMWTRVTLGGLALAVVVLLIAQVGWNYVVGTKGAAGVRASPLRSTNELRDSVYETLAQAVAAANAGNQIQAAAAVQQVSEAIHKARHNALNFPPENFNEVSASLDRVQAAGPSHGLSDALFQARVELAEYRSALEPPEAVPEERAVITVPRSLAAGKHITRASYSAVMLDGREMPQAAEFFMPHSRLFVDDIWVDGVTLEGASQTLDGIHWKDVTFANVHLRYQGGEVELRNVRFVNCTFGFANHMRSASLADAIARGSTSIVLE